MKNKYGYRIMGKLYHKAFKSFSVSKTINDFFDHVLKVPCTPPTQADIFHFDYYSKQALLDFQNLLSDQDKYVAHLESRVKHLSGEQRRDFNSKLYSIVTSVENYSPYGERTKEFDESGYRTYESRDLDSLAVYLSDAEEHFSLSYNIYLLIYLSVYKCLPRNFFFGTRYMPSLMEFNEEVTCKYGINSRPGTRAIINLVKKADAKDVNIFALYEYAEMLFYGIQNGPEPDINAAFEAFKSISNMNDGSPCHPLAHWSLSFIYFNYRQRGSELEDCDIIPELDDMELIDRVTKSLIHAKYAFILTKNPAAANILGKICMLTDDDVPGIEEIIKKHRLKTAVDYFEEATKQNYIYAFGSLSNVYLEKMFEDPTNQEDHLNKYLEALKGQADQFEPWAANKLGLFYLTGTVKSRKTQETLTFDRIDRNLSYEYFEKAVQYYFDSNSGWAYANMIVNFPKKYIADEDYSKLKSHLEKLVKIHNEEAINYVRDNFKGVYGVFEDNKTCDELLRIINK